MEAENDPAQSELVLTEQELWDCSGIGLAELRETRNPVLMAVIERLRRRAAAADADEGAYSGFSASL